MSLLTRAYARLCGLPSGPLHDVEVQHDVEIPMPDGAVLLATRLAPVGVGDAPILLCRTPYGRVGLFAGIGHLLAERGYQVLTVSCRGTFGSGGEWEPFRHEQADGHAVLSWLEQQPWFSGRVGLFSGSYCGLTQWAVIEDAPPWLQAWAPGVTSSAFGRMFHPGGSFALASALTWISSIADQERPVLGKVRGLVRGYRRLSTGFSTLPLAEADVVVAGCEVPSYRDWLEHQDPAAAWWSEVDFGKDVAKVPPAAFVAGWYDLFVQEQLEDVKRLQAAGRRVRLTIGPWTHGNPKGAAATLRETLAWMDAHLRDRPLPTGAPVQAYDMGAGAWRGFDSWPPACEASRWHLAAHGSLQQALPGTSAPSQYRYDPTDPTPSVGGASLHQFDSGAKDNRKVEARADVLTFTTDVLRQDVTVVGDVTAQLHVRSSLDHVDFFARLCDVDPKGRSTNLCDGIIRLEPQDISRSQDGSYQVRLVLAPTANTFKAGHRIRLQVSSGAHPLYARNPGSGEPMGKATTLIASDQEVLHDPEHVSFVELPLVVSS